MRRSRSPRDVVLPQSHCATSDAVSRDDRDGTSSVPVPVGSSPATGPVARSSGLVCFQGGPQRSPAVVAQEHTTRRPRPPVGTRAGRAGPRFGPEGPACHTLTARSRTSSCRGTRPRPRCQPRGPFPPSQRVSVYILSLVDFYSKSNPETKTRHLLTVKQRKRNPIPKTSRFREVVVVPESIGGGQNAKVEPL